MGMIKGGFLRLFQTFLYFLAFCCAGIVLGFYSYFLSVLADRNQHISTDNKAIEGLSGVTVIYTIFATVLTCCLAGITFFGVIGLLLDICFCGAMIALAVLTRNGASSCNGIVHTPLGTGPAKQHFGFQSDAVYKVTFGHACEFNTACFAVSVIGAFIFAITALMQIVLMKSHKKEARFGPGPNNNYTSGSGAGRRKMFGRKSNNKEMPMDNETGTAPGMVGGLAAPAVDTRGSHETGYTGTTMGGTGPMAQDKVEPGYTNAGYHTAPTGTSVSPYGYNNNNVVGNTGTNY